MAPGTETTRGRERREASAESNSIPGSRFVADELADFERASALEWLETNGLGGWASSTVSGAHTRRYHGLLVAATRPPADRRVLLSKLEETLVLGGAGASARIELGANQFPGVVHPRGFESLAEFTRAELPRWTYAGGGFRLRKTIAAVHGENTTIVLYELLESEGLSRGAEGGKAASTPVETPAVALELRPLFAGREIHSLGAAEPGRIWRASGVSAGCVRFSSGATETAVFVDVGGAEFRAGGDWYYRFEYAEERARGFDFREDLYLPGVFTVQLAIGQPVGVVISTAERPGRDARRLLADELARRQGLVARAGVEHPLARRLVLAADQFMVARSGANAGGATLLAGYPWFADWGRDAMIALPGLCLATGRAGEAREVLRAFLGALSEGMLPNRFPEQGEAPEYNTVDATLWLFVAGERYFRATGDAEFVRTELLPRLEEVLTWHGRGTRYGIGVGGDGLLRAGAPGVQLTWMDAKVGEEVVTPRSGMPVEIEALWYNALRITAAFHRRFGGRERAAMLRQLAAVVRRRFEERFWNDSVGALFDVVSAEGRDPSCRPNQIYALSLPYPLLGREKAAAVLATVEQRLLTPRGLRSLAADEPGYCRRYEGGPAERDRAYHQGTVWSFLLGAYVDAIVRYRGSAGRRQGRELLSAFATHLDEACLGSVSEIFDAEPPHRPRGAFAQAWSVGELLRSALCVGLR
ncbi:MAG: glycogen debranching enzyme family protein [Holophagales bacterium]|nr:MAG: glycogen debranching enzyme family protein [Holophagales bacterium]